MENLSFSQREKHVQAVEGARRLRHSTSPGGAYGTHEQRQRVRAPYLSSTAHTFDNQSHGGKYRNTFISACSMQPDDPFLVVALHPSLGVPTQALRNAKMPSWPVGAS